MSNYPIETVREQFPVIVNHPDIAFLDSAASSQRPQQVVDRIEKYYEYEHANVHRGLYALSEKATLAYENVRQTAADFLGGVQPEEIIFTKGTTDGINLVAQILGEAHVEEGDEIILSVAEHHSNIVPWQIMAQKTGAIIKYITLDDHFRLDLEEAQKLFSDRTKIMAVAHVSNVLGTIHPVKELCELAKNWNALSVIDGAQAAPHLTIDLKDIGCDFYALSGHKMLGPTGIGLLYGRKELLDSLPPYQGGGDMIEQVTLEGSTWAELPSKYEAGTPNIAGAIGLGSAIEYLNGLNRKEAMEHDVALGTWVYEELAKKSQLKVFAKPGPFWVGVVTFYHEGIHPHDLASICAEENVCIRAGHHCAQPLMKYLGVPATARVSPYLYNNRQDVERFIMALEKAERLLL